jgi:hypothetical protein
MNYKLYLGGEQNNSGAERAGVAEEMDCCMSGMPWDNAESRFHGGGGEEMELDTVEGDVELSLERVENSKGDLKVEERS